MTQQEKDNLYDELREQRHAEADDLRDRLYDEWKEQRKDTRKKYTTYNLGPMGICSSL